MEDVTLRYFADATASTNALRAGDVDMLYNMQAPDLVCAVRDRLRLPGAPGHVERRDPARPEQPGRSLRRRARAPGDRVRHRPPGGPDAAWAGYGQLIGAMVPPTDPYYEDLNDLYPYDPERRANCSPRRELRTCRSRSRCPRSPLRHGGRRGRRLAARRDRRHREDRDPRIPGRLARRGVHEGRLRDDGHPRRRAARHPDGVQRPRLLHRVRQLEDRPHRRRGRRGERRRSGSRA